MQIRSRRVLVRLLADRQKKHRKDEMSSGKVQRGIVLSLRLANGDAMREIYEMTASK